MKKQLLLTLTVLCVSSLLSAKNTTYNSQDDEAALVANGTNSDEAASQAEMKGYYDDGYNDEGIKKGKAKQKNGKKSNGSRRKHKGTRMESDPSLLNGGSSNGN